MKAKLLHQTDGLRTYVVALGTGDDPSEQLLAFAEDADISAAALTGIGAFRRATLGWFDVDAQDYRPIEVDEQVEVVSLTGNVARTEQGQTKVHVHLVVANSEGTAMGGHLLSGEVRPTLEVMVIESDSRLQRTIDPETGLPLLPR